MIKNVKIFMFYYFKLYNKYKFSFIVKNAVVFNLYD